MSFGLTTRDHDTVSLVTSFDLVVFAGYQVVYGVAPVLHSPIMVATNTTSAMTADGKRTILVDSARNTGSIAPDFLTH